MEDDDDDALDLSLSLLVTSLHFSSSFPFFFSYCGWGRKQKKSVAALFRRERGEGRERAKKSGLLGARRGGSEEERGGR